MEDKTADKAAEELASAEAEMDELNNVEIGLESDAIVSMAAKKRFEYAQAYQMLQIDHRAAEASASINERMKNTQARDNFYQRANTMATEMKHCLKAILMIDKQYPEAKAVMLAMVKAQQKPK